MMNLTSFIKKIKTQIWLKSNKDFWYIKLPIHSFKEIETDYLNFILQKINKENTFLKKECGINFLFLSKANATILIEDKFIHIPVLLISIESNILQLPSSFEELLNENVFVINPLLKIYLENFYSTDTINQLGKTLFQLDEKIVKFNWEICEIGIYNVFRFFPTLHDLDILENQPHLSPALLKMVGNDVNEEKQSINPTFLFESDQNQRLIFDKLIDNSIIIQGPPGTGKTQTLANITGTYLAENKTVLIVSEKKAALDVLQSKLKERNLAKLCLNTTERFNEKHIFNELKDTWLFFEKSSIKSILPNEVTYQELLDVWFGEHHEELKEIAIQLIQSVQSSTKIYLPITVFDWKNQTHFFTQLNAAFFKAISYLKPVFFKSELTIQEVKNQLIEGISIVKKFSIVTSFDLENSLRKSSDFILFNSATYKKYGHLVGKKQMKFLSIRKKWNQLQIKKSLFEKTHLSQWIKIPSKIELDYLIQLHDKKGFFATRKWKKEWKKWVRTTELNPEEPLKKTRDYYNLLHLESLLLEKLSTLSIESTTEIETVYHFLSTINEEHFHLFIHAEKKSIEEFIAHQSDFIRLQRYVNTYFEFKKEESLQNVFTVIGNELSQIFALKKELNSLPAAFFSQLKNFNSFAELNQAFLRGRWSELTRFNARLSEFTYSELLHQLTDFQKNKELRFQSSADEILKTHFQRFNAFHQLIKTENRKLSKDQKALKEALKKGKSILVKEFSKQRNHLTLRQLMDSEASNWIFLLKPIWLTNPSTISLSFPMKRELFDIVLFDEAGRIPLSNALGALQRAKKCVVAGDSQQMTPSNFFQQQHSEENYSLLHQATFYLDNVMLRHHYRSYYPELISFSNEHFYNNQLAVFPCAFRPETEILKFHFIENGKYIDRNNFAEAQQITRYYFSLPDSLKASNKIGIVAFSESQLQCIWNCFSNQQQNEVLKSIDTDRLFFKTLEQVQGDECDILLISFGYGKNENENFELRFGPINQLNGDKRLNVLFSRARKSIQFFASVQASDFPIIENPSVRTLWLWFLYLENYKSEPKVENKMDFISFVNGFTSKEEASRMIKLYQERGWKFKI